MVHGVYGDNDRRICPDCETVCPETARVCPGCGRKFRMVYPPAFGHGYALPGMFASSVAIGWLGARLSCSPLQMRYLLLLPMVIFLLSLPSVCHYCRRNWQGVGLARRIGTGVFVAIMSALLALMLESIGFAVYWAERGMPLTHGG
jgi:hypothetical protein